MNFFDKKSQCVVKNGEMLCKFKNGSTESIPYPGENTVPLTIWKSYDCPKNLCGKINKNVSKINKNLSNIYNVSEKYIEDEQNLPSELLTIPSIAIGNKMLFSNNEMTEHQFIERTKHYLS